MMPGKFGNALLSLFVFASCVSVRESAKYTFSDGVYKTAKQPDGTTHVKVDAEENDIVIQPFIPSKTKIDLLPKITYPLNKLTKPIDIPIYRKNSFDIDFLTIPLKFRPSVAGIPQQLNTSLNGAAYIGYRTDFFRIFYQDGGNNGYERKMTHYGFSLGGFAGLGSTPMNPTVTLNRIELEYDGVVWSKGVAAIFGIDRFTFGLVLGFDNLLDKNKDFWIYQGKPWIGLGFGLNLN